MRRYRTGAIFVLDPSKHSTALDRNARARILHTAEILERATKPAGCRNGVVSIPGLIVLRVLLLRFQNGATGLCCPSYDALQKATGFCRQTIANAIERLEAIGLLKVTRRLTREINDVGVLICRQGSNLYGFSEAPARIDLGSVNRPARARRFSRVHVMGTNHIPSVKPPLWWMRSESEVGSAKVGSGDWRDRARAAMLRTR